MLKKSFTILILLIYFIAPFKISAEPVNFSLQPVFNLENYLQPFYARYSNYLDTVYNSNKKIWYDDAKYLDLPSKQYIWQSEKRSREIMSFATFYKNRAQGSAKARSKIEWAILKSTLYSYRPLADQSFDQAIAYFLVLRLMDQIENPDLFSKSMENKIYDFIKKRIPYGLKANDTENRAALAGVYWLAAAQILYYKSILSSKEFLEINKQTQKKVELSTAQTLNDDYVYREVNHKYFSLHYHIVEAYMLYAFGKLTQEKKYTETARQMTEYANSLAGVDGFLDAHLGHRPQGSGAQAYIMLGLLNQAFENYVEAQVFFDYAKGSKFFKDPQNSNRLVWWDTSLAHPQEFFDDYSLANMGELGLILNNQSSNYNYTN